MSEATVAPTVVEYAATAGKEWGEASVARNGDDMRRLREAVDFINTDDGCEALVAGYAQGGGDKATASRIRKILTQARLNEAHKAIVKDPASNSLQGCYKRIQASLKPKAEAEPKATEVVVNPIGAGDPTVDLPALIARLTHDAAQAAKFHLAAGQHLVAAIKLLQDWEAPKGE